MPAMGAGAETPTALVTAVMPAAAEAPVQGVTSQLAALREKGTAKVDLNWGTGVYTHDSSVCGAAMHAGAIPSSGGKVTIKSAAGCPKYKGTLGHGIMSSNWGSYGGSFYFAGSGDGSCAK